MYYALAVGIYGSITLLYSQQIKVKTMDAKDVNRVFRRYYSGLIGSEDAR